MIHINLLPVRAAKKREFGRQQLILFGLILVGGLLGNYTWWKAEKDSLTTLEQRIASTRTEIAQLKILDALKKGRTGPVKVMDELATIIPNKAWITEYTEQNGNVVMRGFAVTYEDLSAFAQRLKTSKYFANVTIKKASQKNQGGSVEWEIDCNANYAA